MTDDHDILAAAPRLGVPGRRQIYLAAAPCIAVGLFSAVLAVWPLDDSETSDRLVARPWSCCLADLPSSAAQD